jgi:hypothetical protein
VDGCHKELPLVAMPAAVMPQEAHAQLAAPEPAVPGPQPVEKAEASTSGRSHAKHVRSATLADDSDLDDSSSDISSESSISPSGLSTSHNQAAASISSLQQRHQTDPDYEIPEGE